jgi:NAD(P)-dependent dehydrogenase (short-subunit alcohol dehydrogenase family)
VNAAEFCLDGKVILVTGGAGLIGTEICDALAAYGATVILCDILAQGQLDAQATALRARYPNSQVVPVQTDITSDDSVTALFNTIDGLCGKLDVLVNLAAIDAKFDDRADEINPTRFENYPLALWDQSVAVNCTGLIRATQAALRMMLPRKSGNIINVASTYALVAPNQGLYRIRGGEGQVFKPVDYVGTKSMLPNLTRYMATLYACHGIRCNCIVPHGVFNNHQLEFLDNFSRLSPMGRMCDVKELRGPFVFLASDASSYMTGSTLVVDGGWTAW